MTRSHSYLPINTQLAETLASGEAASLVEEGLWDMAREVVRAYEAGEMPKGSEGGFLVVVCLMCFVCLNLCVCLFHIS